METNSQIHSAIERFADIARRYCEWAEGSPADPKLDMQQARLLLTELHLAIINLPDLGLGEDIDSELISHDLSKAVGERFSHLPIIGYWDVFDPLVEESPVFWQLPDDLAEIHSNIKESLNLFDAGHIVDAVWEWRFSFRTHWGQNLLGAQRAIHAYLQHEEL